MVSDDGIIHADDEAALRTRGTPCMLGSRLLDRKMAIEQAILDETESFDSNDDCYRCISDAERKLVVAWSRERARRRCVGN